MLSKRKPLRAVHFFPWELCSTAVRGGVLLGGWAMYRISCLRGSETRPQNHGLETKQPENRHAENTPDPDIELEPLQSASD